MSRSLYPQLFGVSETNQRVTKFESHIHLWRLFEVFTVLIGLVQRILVVSGKALCEEVIYHEVEVGVYKKLDPTKFNYKVFLPARMHLNLNVDLRRLVKLQVTYAVFDVIEVFNCVSLIFVAEQNQILICLIEKVAAYLFNIYMVVMPLVQEVVDDNI